MLYTERQENSFEALKAWWAWQGYSPTAFQEGGQTNMQPHHFFKVYSIKYCADHRWWTAGQCEVNYYCFTAVKAYKNYRTDKTLTIKAADKH